MKLENGYKVLYAAPVKDEATGKVVEFNVSASRTGLFENADQILTIANSFKLVYEKDGKIYGSTQNIPTVKDGVIEDANLSEAGLNKVFEKTKDNNEAESTEQQEQPKEDEVVNNSPDEGQDDEGQEDDDETDVPSDEE
jgi:hypothetical protein